MSAGIMFDCGDVLIVPVPFSDLTATKQRPVIVVTPQSYMEEANGDFRRTNPKLEYRNPK
jgi:hypothetical protein